MSSFKKFFGSKKPEGSETRAAVKQLEDTRDLLTKKSEFLEKKIAEEIALAKKYGMKNKKMALKALARKKGYESQLQKIDNTVLIIENQIQSIDNAGMNLEVFKVLKTTAGTLKTAHKNLKIDDVHDIMDDIAEQRDIANEISDAISNTSAFGLDVDEDELLAELEDLENQLLDVGSVSDLPNVPTKELPGPSKSKTEDTSDKDLNELLAWAE
ncbi:Charged multivesicular body protein 4 [Paragonimus heterotremus]|uniref:Charged multivesicular body protein 4 n=1 Tax=Paragonimus heterotremus TaxID=100268 RepID=A0A8J4T0Q4_9TREM|nr:Charged multivesicular body protein 4 [Paragonimus heterotremus]